MLADSGKKIEAHSVGQLPGQRGVRISPRARARRRLCPAARCRSRHRPPPGGKFLEGQEADPSIFAEHYELGGSPNRGPRHFLAPRRFRSAAMTLRRRCPSPIAPRHQVWPMRTSGTYTATAAKPTRRWRDGNKRAMRSRPQQRAQPPVGRPPRRAAGRAHGYDVLDARCEYGSRPRRRRWRWQSSLSAMIWLRRP